MSDARLESYFDNELDPAERATVETHLGDCPECAEALHQLGVLRGAMRNPALTVPSPPYLAARIRAALAEAEPSARPTNWRAWAALAAGLLLASLLVWWFITNRPGTDQRTIAQEVVSSHVRSLLANHLLDVPSSDRHTVKPWFNGKLDFSPPVKDFAPDYRLTGGRLDYLAGRTVAALVYQRRLHYINLFIWPATRPDSAPQPVPIRNGYNVVRWISHDMQFWAVSDIPAPELEGFGRLYRE